MSKLQEIRTGKDFSQQDITAILQAEGQRVDVSLLSKMENDICLPTPPTAEILCNVLECSLYELFSPAEVDFSQCATRAKNSPSAALKQQKGRTERKVQFRLTEHALQVLASGTLELCGYRTKTEWFYECVRQLEERGLRIKENATHSVRLEVDSKLVNSCHQALFTSNISQT